MMSNRGKEKGIKTGIEEDTQTDKVSKTDIHIGRQTDRQTDSERLSQTHTDTDRHTDRQTDLQTDTLRYRYRNT